MASPASPSSRPDNFFTRPMRATIQPRVLPKPLRDAYATAGSGPEHGLHTSPGCASDNESPMSGHLSAMPWWLLPHSK